MAVVSLRRLRGLMVFFPFLKLLMAHSAAPDLRARSFVEKCFAAARTSSRYLASATLVLAECFMGRIQSPRFSHHG